MKINILLTLALVLSFPIAAMEQSYAIQHPQPNLLPSLKIIAAMKMVLCGCNVSIEMAPEEIIEFLNKIKDIINADWAREDKKFLMALLDEPNLDIEKYFPNLIRRYVEDAVFINKSQILNSMLLLAISVNEPLVVKIVISLGADVNTRGSIAGTALKLAVLYNYIEIVQILLDNNVNLNALDKHSEAALHLAVRKNHKELVRIMLDKGADSHITNSYGLTPLTLATMHGHKEIAQILEAKKENKCLIC